MQRVLRPLASAAAAALLALAATGCGSGSVGDTAGEGSRSDSSAEPGGITVRTDRGTVTIDQPATRVVSLEWTYTEELIALGVQPIANADNDGNGAWITAPGAYLD